MNTKNKIQNVGKMSSVIVLCLLFFSDAFIYAQESSWSMTRSKVWLGSEHYSTQHYPGYYDQAGGSRNQLKGQTWSRMTFLRNGIGEMKKDGEPYMIRIDIGEGRYELPHPYKLYRNHNFSQSLDLPEEYSFCEVLVDRGPDKELNGKVTVKSKLMAWSLPKYDDFIIIKQTFINADVDPLTDFYVNHLTQSRLSNGGKTLGFNYDTEYIWDPTIRTFCDEQGAFIFYDDTSIPYTSPDQPVVYEISPGNVTGDRGDPGNILNANSIDYQLYSPQVVCDVVADITPNRNGEKKVIRHIFGPPGGQAGGVTPDAESFWWEYHDYDRMKGYILTEQTRKSWLENKQDPNTIDGNVYERVPQYGFSIGPYDLAPGDSINLLKIYACGEMDRNISMLGGLNATQNFKQQGIANLKANIEAAFYLIEHNYRPDAYPPPTPAGVPQEDNDVELIVEPFVDPESVTQGFDVKWPPIPESYVDPIKGTNDLAGYKIYKSELSVMGPWNEIEDLSKAEANALVQGGLIVYRTISKVGIPSYFLVTSYDTDGNESGETAYNVYPVFAEAAPSNDLAKVRVVPNPFKQESGLLAQNQEKRLIFMNIPSMCTIKIFTIAGELVQTLEHDGGFGTTSWGTDTQNNYMGTRFQQNVAPGVYIYHVESHVPGHEGEEDTGKFIIIK